MKINKDRLSVIQLKEEMLSIKGKIHPNSKEYYQYINVLLSKCEITPYQHYCLLGLLLSDASLQLNEKQDKSRIKMQQTIKRADFMNHLIMEVFPEWTFQKQALLVSKSRQDMVYFQTLSLSVFNKYIPLFYDKVNKKIITDELVKELHPITLAYWFAGDGGKDSYHKRAGSGKAITLNTQGFDEQSIDKLVDALNSRYQWNVDKVKEKGAQQWFLKIKDYDDFIVKVGPYVHPTIINKLPTARSDKSQHGYITQEIFDEICGSFFKPKG